jgi:hypothetical protein
MAPGPLGQQQPVQARCRLNQREEACACLGLVGATFSPVAHRAAEDAPPDAFGDRFLFHFSGSAQCLSPKNKRSLSGPQIFRPQRVESVSA